MPEHLELLQQASTRVYAALSGLFAAGRLAVT